MPFAAVITSPSGRYAPFPLVNDPSEVGLRQTVVSSNLGTVVAHHRPQRATRRATLFLHGAAGSWSTWTPVLLADRATGGAIGDPVLVDLPGWGAATLNEGQDVATLDAVCELVRSAALELGYAQWDLVGHSMGGFIALHMAARWPDEVRSVVTVSGTTWSVVEAVAQPVRGFGTLPGFVMLWRVMTILAGLGAIGLAIVRAMRAARVLRLAVAPLFRHPLVVGGSVVDALSREIRPRAFLAAVDVTRGYDPGGTWASIDCPVTAIKGDQDVFVRDFDLQRLSRLLPAARAIVIPDCGHFANVERPHSVLDALLANR